MVAIQASVIFSLLASVAQAADAAYQPRPYTVNVDKKFIEDTRLRAANFRPTPNIDAPAWFDGPPGTNLSAIAKYWANEFNFERFQNEINTNFSNYITTVPAPGGGYNRTLDIHFFHQVSKRKDAIPILMLHGWPSTNLEWAEVIPSLVSPPNASLPAFHVVAPDLPGFGFSPAPTAPGLGAEEHAIAFASLMQQLGYSKFVLYSTDLGFVIARRMVPKYVDRIINHVSDFYLVFPSENDTQRYNNNQTNAVETAYLKSLNSYLTDHSAYASIHSTYPLSLAYALYDSPVGFLAWVWQLTFTASDYLENAEQLIRRTLGLYIPGPYNNIRAYKELFGEWTEFPGIKTKVPTSILQFGGNVGYPTMDSFNYAPLDWVKRTANVTYFSQHPKGGHFPAQTQPKLWLEDIWRIFAKKA